ncbi:FAD-dependent oxidoreductase [Pseudomonas gingeri NCPPB 3146 = LMG 5327]|uniref:Tryptophan 2-monooxygenase n=2 Tax=Pseudomonas gingeri TaxID=117681 RepID=A0A7Y7Y2P7_9PSED|nr:FAD-dependent oxidoreductase [Pseudomonas gingeri]NWC16655.1 FAD-dependent oxidoreductase [Pseudomonas gingeri]PNQ90002.1 FAD-dependent oxidoreductase [Pseudomonas gingeri NCPPB 3146 = LMG 5327]
MPLTRRQLIARVAAVGGLQAATAVMGLLGVDQQATAGEENYAALPIAAVGKGASVIVIGAGIGGLVSAFELKKAGFKVTLLEARERVGGRNWTVRHGDRVEYTDGSVQVADFDKGFYLNAGPGRLPSHHQLMLGYCRELGVELEVLVNTSRNALVRPDLNAPPLQIRQAVNDSRGHFSELLAKAVNRNALDQELSPADRSNLLSFLKTWGDLSDKLEYLGSARSGYKVWPGAGDQLAQKRDPLPLQTLLNPALTTALMIDEYPEFSPTMFQPVGGMDRIPKAFERHLKAELRLGVEVRSIDNQADFVEVGYLDRRSGRSHSLLADYVISALPLPLLAKVENNLTQPVRQAIAAVQFGYANKVAWQSRRFWESDYQIYGGLSFINQEASGLWYPSGGFNQAEGVLVAAYNNGEIARRFGEKSLDEQIALSRQAVELLHPGHGHELRKPLAIAWARIPYNLGPWINHEVADPDYSLLNQAQGRVYLTSDGLAHSGVGIWQEAAAGAARRVVRHLFERAQRSPIKQTA